MGAIANDWLVPLSAEFKKAILCQFSIKKVVERVYQHMWCIRHPMRSLLRLI